MTEAGCSSTTESRMNKVYITDLPDTTCHWLLKDELVYLLFKARTCSFGVDTIFWPDDESKNNLESWFLAVDKTGWHTLPGANQECFKYFNDILDFPDISDLTKWYESKSKEELVANTDTLLLRANTKLNKEDLYLRIPTQFRIRIGHFLLNLQKWLATLASILQTPPALLTERAYEECFRKFAETFDLNCQSGDTCTTWKFGYDYRKDLNQQTYWIRSKPDLILYKINYTNNQQSGVAVVEVKKLKDPIVDWSHVASQESMSTSAAKKIKLSGDDEPEDSLAAPLLEEKYINGNPRRLSESQKRRCQLFLPQLLGDAVAATNNTTMRFQRIWHLNEDHRSLIGMAVLGFDVHFVNFITITGEVRLKKKWSMHEIPITKGAGLDILISEPLNLLKRQDRNKLFKALFAMQTMKYVVWD